MRSFLYAVVIFFVSKYSIADTRIISCLDSYSAEKETTTSVVVSHGSRPIGVARIDHQLDGGAFNLDNSMLVTYGLPNDANVDYPQTTRLTIYALKNRPRAIFNDTYGSGVDAVAFSADEKYIIVSTRFGQSIINLVKRKSKSFDVTHEFDMQLQECKSDKK